MAESEPDPRPLLVVTVLLDQAARPALVTQSHGDAMERAISAAAAHDIAGLELAELPIATLAFAALRRSLTMPPSTVALYDIFPLATGLPTEIRAVAGQFLAAEALWTLEEQGMLGGVAAEETFQLPSGWSKDPKDIRQRLVDAGASALPPAAVETFQKIKTAWDAALAA